MAEARTPDYIRKMEEFKATERAVSEAIIASRAGIEVTDEASCAQAAELLSRVTKVVKAGHKARTDASKPYRDSTDLINKEFKEMLSPIEAVEERFRKEVTTFERNARLREEEEQRKHAKEVADHEAAVKKAADEEEARREAARKAEEAGKAPPPAPAAPEPVVPPLPPPPPPPVARSGKRQTSSGSVSTKTVWKFELIDLALVPNDLKLLNEPEVRKRIAEGAREIKGLRIYPDERVTVR